MKILMVASDNYRFSGAFLCLVRLAVHLKYDLNNEVRVVVPFEGTGTELLKENDIDYDMVYSPNWVSSKLVCKNPCKPLFSYLKFFNYKKYEKNVLDYLNQFKPDVVHINTSWCFLFGKVAIKNGFHCVWQIQEFLYEDQNMHFINKRMAIKLLSKADVVATISNSINEKYLGYGLHNTKIILDGLYVDKYYDDHHKIFKDDIIKFLFIGGVSKKKGQFEFLEWLGKYSNENQMKNFELRIVGNCSDNSRDKLNKIAKKHHIENNVVIVGPKSNTMEEYLNADIQIVNSKKEAFGRVTVEGILAGCCVLASNSGGSNEIISNGKNGFLYEQGNYNDFAKKLTHVLENKESVKNMILSGQIYTKNKFDSLRNAQEFNDVYEEIRLKKSVTGGVTLNVEFINLQVFRLPQLQEVI